MRLIIQSVSQASVEVNNKEVSSIGEGILVYIAFSTKDSYETLNWGVKKVLTTRIFPYENKNFKLNVEDYNADILLVPQFTLYGDLSQNTKPNFKESLDFKSAKNLFDKFVESVEIKTHCRVSTGVFGADMNIKSTNIGPKTLILEK